MIFLIQIKIKNYLGRNLNFKYYFINNNNDNEQNIINL